jgi:chromosome segregation ATPase
VADIDVNLQKKYDNALNQIETMYAENNMLKAENSNLRNEIMSWRSRLEALDKARIKELEELRGSMSVLHRSQVDREMRELTARYNQERSQLEAEIKRLRDILEVKTRELDDWRSKASALETRVNDLQSKTGQNIQMENRIAELENKLALFSQEIERLNLQLKERNNEILELNKRYKIIDLEVQKKDNELREHFRRSGALEQETDRMKQLVAQLQARSGQNPELEAKLVKMSEEIERLNSVLKLSTTEKMELSTRLNRLEFEYESLRKNTTSDITLVKTQYESKIGVLNQEIDRLGQENRMS